MKIEKLTENKIRVIISSDDLIKQNINIHTVLTKESNFQNLFLNILKRAEKETGFYTEGCKLLIEIFSFSEEIVVFTITKYSSSDLKEQNGNIETKKKKLVVKRKNFNVTTKKAIYGFNDFEIFCEFCNSLKNLDIKKICKNTILYSYKNTYYLVIKNINNNYEKSNMFFSKLSEFAILSPYSNNFENKLVEHGKTVIKKDAIGIGIKYFNIT